jgi:three-Cys-motif partner protein
VPNRTAIDFFHEPTLASLAKLELFGKYLRPWSRKLGSGWNHLWIVDGFAGAGSYESEGGPVNGSPRVAATWAAQEMESRGHPLVKCINVERDRQWFEQLVENTSEWPELVTNLHGEFATRLDDVLRMTNRDPAFFFLDPFGVRGIEMTLLERITTDAHR